MLNYKSINVVVIISTDAIIVCHAIILICLAGFFRERFDAQCVLYTTQVQLTELLCKSL